MLLEIVYTLASLVTASSLISTIYKFVLSRQRIRNLEREKFTISVQSLKGKYFVFNSFAEHDIKTYIKMLDSLENDQEKGDIKNGKK